MYRLLAEENWHELFFWIVLCYLFVLHCYNILYIHMIYYIVIFSYCMTCIE